MVEPPGTPDRADALLAGVPNLPGRFLSRPRLLAALDDVARHPLIVVRGPGGSGKSALVADWLRHRDALGASIWLVLAAGSGSRPAFWRRVEGALARAGILPADEPGEPAGAPREEAFAPARIVDALAGADRPVRIAIDDFHHSDPQVADDLAWVLERTPNLRVVVATRRREAFEDGVTRARIDVAVLATDELAFTSDESAALVRRSVEVPDAVAEALHAATQGHPLALRLAIAALETEPGDVDAGEVTARVTALAARHFLPVFPDEARTDAAVRLAVTPYTDTALATALTGREDIGDLMLEFERDGIGNTRDERDGSRFSFHPLVARALADQLDARDRDEVVGWRLLAAEYLEIAGDPTSALRQLLAAEQYDRVWPLVTRNFSDFWNHYGPDLEAALDPVPLAVMRRHPTLAISLAVIRVRREPVPSTLIRTITEEAIAALRLRMPTAAGPERFLLLTALLGGYRVTNRYVEGAEAADALLSMLDGLPVEQERRAIATIDVVLVQIAVGAILGGRLDDALTAARRVSPGGNPWRTLHARSISALVAALQGETLEASRQTALIVEHDSPHEWRGSFGALGWHVAEALASLDRFDPAAALDVLGQLDAERDVVDLWPYPVWARGFSRLLGDEAESGAQEILELLARMGRRPSSDYARDLLHGVAADLLLASGQPVHARRMLGRPNTGGAPVLLARARLALADDAPGDALALVEPVRADERWTSRQRVEALLLAAVAHARLDLSAEGRADAEAALSVIDRTGAAATLAMAPTAELLGLAPDGPLADLVAASPDPFAEALTVTRLTPRERDVLTALVSVSGVEAIAETLYVSVNTVKTQLRGLYRKLGVTSRADAVRVARRRGLIDS